MTIVLRYLPRRLVPLYERDWRSTDALFRMTHNRLLKMIRSVGKTYGILLSIGNLTPRIKKKLKELRGLLIRRYFQNMIVEVPQRNPRVQYERQTFARFLHEFCNDGNGYLSVQLSEMVRFRSLEDLHR